MCLKIKKGKLHEHEKATWHNLQTIYECVSKIDEQIFGMNVSINSQPYLGRATKQHVQ